MPTDGSPSGDKLERIQRSAGRTVDCSLRKEPRSPGGSVELRCAMLELAVFLDGFKLAPSLAQIMSELGRGLF